MAAIYETYDDQHVANYLIYDKNDGYAYTDSGKTTKFTTSALKDYFTKGAIIVLNSGAYAVPVGYSEAGDPAVGSVSYIKPNSVTATSADIATLVGVADPS